MDVNIPVFPMVPFHFLAYLEYESLPESGVRLGVMIESAADGRGLEVKQVVSGSTAERAGVRKGDRLLSFDGDHLSESSDLIYAVKKKQPGQQGTLQIERQGQALTVDVLFQDAGSISTGTR
jgi:S1-C subfamily serine protease